MEHLEEILGVVVPILVYWVYSGFYEVLGSLERFQKYRIHTQHEEDRKNLVPRADVIKGVVLVQVIQAVVISLVYMVTKGSGSTTTQAQPSLLVVARQFIVAMVVIDTYMYFAHRLWHLNKFLYRHIHAHHHQLIVPYAFGTQYGHPIDALVVDTMSGALAYLVSGMSPRTSIFFFSFTFIKAIDDHCGMRLPWNIFHLLFWNNTAYHDVHHFHCSNYNYAQPFFVMWDKILGTYMPCKLEKRSKGGFEVRRTTH